MISLHTTKNQKENISDVILKEILNVFYLQTILFIYKINATPQNSPQCIKSFTFARKQNDYFYLFIFHIFETRILRISIL